MYLILIWPLMVKVHKLITLKINLTKIKDTCILMLRSYLLSLVHMNFYPLWYNFEIVSLMGGNTSKCTSTLLDIEMFTYSCQNV